MTIYYLYIKTHIDTGLKYLGQTKNKDPYKYLGSGKRWLNHLSKHGNNIKTEILLQTTDKMELRDIGLYFSKLFNIVNSNDWANLKEESADGGWDYINSNREEIYLKTLGYSNPMQVKIVRDKQSETQKRNATVNIQKRKFNSLEKYGVDHYSKNDEALQKRNEVLLNKYGVDNIAKRQDVKNKFKEIRNSLEYKEHNYCICDHCNKNIDPGNYKRWHGDNCKMNKIKTVNGESFV